ncbi:MAG TPA: glycerol-3-phosphate dehydrogenase/oxidase [Phycicoccus sp.]|nr:glycerol-3-phosphate dehydrogenase/oxidase [Phycicoccus sp.]
MPARPDPSTRSQSTNRGVVYTPNPTTRLDAATRAATWARTADRPWDVIVVGGGITGAGCALDAAARGLRTLLVERVDLAAGTSRWSSKLVHGGLRYLAKGDLAIAHESALERHYLMTAIAPHLVTPLATIVPLDTRTGRAMGALAEVGIRLGDALRLGVRTPGALLPRPRRISRREVQVHLPGIQPDGLRGGLLYFDGQLEDDARLVVAVARTAAGLGAEVLTHCAATELTERSVRLTDEFTGESVVAEGVVVNATGVWVGEYAAQLAVTPSRGSHVVVRSDLLGDPRAVLTVPVPGHFGRYVFALPQPGGLTYIGLTDEPAPGADGVAPEVPEADIDFLLGTINAALARPLTRADVIGQFAGLRPLVSRVAPEEAGAPAAAIDSADVSRKHLLIDEPGEPITIAGGKLTTYRRMAQDAIDAVTRRLGHGAPCVTTTLPLVGAAPARDLAGLDAPRPLVRRYGLEAQAVWDLRHEADWLAEPVVPGRHTLGVELLWGALAEGALTPEDLVERRTRLAIVDADREPALAAARRALDLARSSGLAHSSSA